MTNPKSGAAPVSPSPDPDRLNRTIATELVPQLLVSHRTEAPPPAVLNAIGQHLTDEQVDQFVQLIRGRDDARVDEFVRALVEKGETPESVYLDLLAPAARRLGVLWEDDRCDFLEVTIGVGRMQRVLRNLSYLFTLQAAAADPVGRALLACAPGEQHSLGLFIVAEFFVKAGWTVEVGAPLDDTEVTGRVRTEWFDLVGNPKLRAIVGGRVFNDNPELVARVGADGSAQTASAAAELARTLISA
jgi:methanogenic corrinoid protein MtbC1